MEGGEEEIASHSLRARFAAEGDLDLLASFNRSLIEDEGHRNPMSAAELRERMAAFLAGDYQAVIFSAGDDPVGYALYRPEDGGWHLRQFFIVAARRRDGFGRGAIAWLLNGPWRGARRITLEVLAANEPAAMFWRSVGFSDYAISMERRAD